MMRIKNYVLVAALALMVCSCRNKDITLSFHISEATGDKLAVTLNGEKNEAEVDSAGVASIVLKDIEPQYAQIKYGRGGRTLFLEPGKDLVISFKGNELWKEVKFEGENAAANDYLNSRQLKAASFNDTEKSEAEFIGFADSLYAANVTLLENAQFGEPFTGMEKTRLKYFTYANFPMYPLYHPYMVKQDSFVPGKAFYDKLRNLTDFDARYLNLNEYEAYIPSAVATLGMEGGITKDYKQITEKQLAYIKANIQDIKLVEYLVNKAVYGYVESAGPADADGLITTFREFVKTPESVQKFDELCGRWAKIAVGNPSPSFKYKDITSKEVALEDLKGKLVYIDVWATWCGPCRGEIPHLQALEHAYAGKDIYFVSISCDQDKNAWQEMVKKEELGGIQLHMDGDKSFMEAYLIRGIPRFILLDREGKIVSGDMSRPSDPATVQKIDGLLSK